MKIEKVAFFDTHPWEKAYYDKAPFDIDFFEHRLTEKTVSLCDGFQVVSGFVNDQLDEICLRQLAQYGVELIVLRCAGYNNVDINIARQLNIKVCRVPGYSPESVAEFTLLQLMCLNRKIHRAYQRTRELNFSLNGLVGTTLTHKSIGVVGTGQIGRAFCKMLSGFDCQILAYDIKPDQELSKQANLEYVSFDQLVAKSDVVSLHVPLNKQTHHLIDQNQIDKMKSNVMIVNTGRGGLIDSKALIGGLKTNKIQGAAIDVYEEEENYFFEDFSNVGVDDDILARLVSFPNVLLTSHQAYLTDLSLSEIARTTLESIDQWRSAKPLTHLIEE